MKQCLQLKVMTSMYPSDFNNDVNKFLREKSSFVERIDFAQSSTPEGRTVYTAFIQYTDYTQ